MSLSSPDRLQLPTEAGLARACDVLRAGGLVAMPTETVYGLAADAENETAVARIFAAKARPTGHPLIVHVASIAEARALAASWPEAAEVLAQRYWPGPLTLIVPRGPRIPPSVTGGRDAVALRVPAHPVALALLRAFGGPLAAPSANRHEHLSPTLPAHVLASLGDAVDLVLDGGATQAGIESTLIDLVQVPPRLLRPGPIGAAALREYLPSLDSAAVVETGAVHSAPGLSRRHYAPRIPLVLAARSELAALVATAGSTWLVRAPAPSLPGTGRVLPDDPAGYAEGLFAALHALEATPGATCIVVERPPAGEAWAAVADRLGRAAAKPGAPSFS